jgi:hypothetical protein
MKHLTNTANREIFKVWDLREELRPHARSLPNLSVLILRLKVYLPETERAQGCLELMDNSK